MMIQSTPGKSIRTSLRLQTPKYKKSDIDKSPALESKTDAKGASAKLRRPGFKMLNLNTTPISSSKIIKAKQLENKHKNKRLCHKWKDDEIIALIKAVGKRSMLWTEDFRRFENSEKNQEWEDILSELRIEGIDTDELKTKWKILRGVKYTSHKKNKPSKWDNYLSFLPFLEAKGNPSTTEKSPKIVVSSLDGSSTPPENHNLELSNPSQEGVSSSTQSSRPAPMNSEAAAFQTPEPNSTFCAHLLAELGMLSEVESRCLRRLLIQQVYDFMDTSEPN